MRTGSTLAAKPRTNSRTQRLTRRSTTSCGARSHNVLQGEIKDGVIRLKGAKFYLESEMPHYYEIALDKVQMRIKSLSDGTLVGYWGGYMKWKPLMYMYTARPANGGDSIGL